MRRVAAVLGLAALVALAACQSAFTSGQPGAPLAADAGGPAYWDELDVGRAQARFGTTTDLMRSVIAPGCAAERNECHNNEDFPDLSSEGNLANLVGLRCNQGVGDRATVEDYCERLADQLRISGGANDAFTASIGWIELVTDADDQFEGWRLHLDRPLPATQAGGGWVIERGGFAVPALGGGVSLAAQAGSAAVTIMAEEELPDPGHVRQGDENRNGVFGDGSGALVVPGDAHASYLVRRLTGVESARPRMPLGSNADTANETARPLTPDELYALMSWINCMSPGESPYAEIHYDCPANAGNQGRW